MSGRFSLRDTRTMPLDLGAELIIDNFAGGGGASEGMEQALGRPVDVAINHNGEALAMHAANHPATAHYQEDVFAIHPGFVTGHRPIGLGWFSPDCKHHSKAKGGKPREKKIRGLAWVTLKWGAFQMPRCIALENVEEFRDWGPLDGAGKPIVAEKGRTFTRHHLAIKRESAPVSLVPKRCACGRACTAKQLTQYSKCIACMRLAQHAAPQPASGVEK